MRPLTYMLTAAAIVLSTSKAIAQDLEPLESFVTGNFYHGLPREQAALYGADAVPRLLVMLEDPAFQNHWHQIVDMLSIVGNEEASDGLIGFFESRFEGDVAPTTFQALAQVPRAMGEIARRGDPNAQAWLERGLMPEDWTERELGWAVPSLDDTGRRLFLSKLNISGLSRVGNQTSLTRLRALQDDLDVRTDVRSVLSPALREAIAVNELILERGADVLGRPSFDRLLRDRLELSPQQ